MVLELNYVLVEWFVEFEMITTESGERGKDRETEQCWYQTWFLP